MLKLEGFAVITELSQEQQQRFIEQLTTFNGHDDIVYGLHKALLLLGYIAVEE